MSGYLFAVSLETNQFYVPKTSNHISTHIKERKGWVKF